MPPATTRNATRAAATSSSLSAPGKAARTVAGAAGAPLRVHGAVLLVQLTFELGCLAKVVLQELQVSDVRVHASTSVVISKPRSCSTMATRRSPRLTRCRALASEHRSFAATSG